MESLLSVLQHLEANASGDLDTLLFEHADWIGQQWLLIKESSTQHVAMIC